MSKKILIVDDEELARRRIISFLKSHSDSFTIAEARNGMEALQLIESFVPDIVFLDIEMPEMTGIDVLLHLKEFSFKVIFQTAYDEFASKAFELSAVDFLHKPFSEERFNAALDRTLALLDQAARLRDLEKHLLQQKRYLRRFAVKVGDRTKVYSEEEVICFTSEEHVTQIHLADIAYAYEHSLSLLEERLDPDIFQRIHRNAIVKLSEIKTIHSGRPTSLDLTNGTNLRVSRDKEKKIRDLFEG